MRPFALAEAPRIDLDEAKARFDRGEANFIDVRSPESYREAHVPGAMLVPLEDLRRCAPELPRDRRLILY